jgi:hypothetical protein
MHSSTLSILLLAAVCLGCTRAMARNGGADSVLLHNSAYVIDADPWLPYGNAAALTRWHADNLSWATLTANYGYGGFVNYNESNRDLRLTADVQSVYRLSRRTAAYGRISYETAGLHNMTGSVFIQPDRYPFNIVEDSLTNAGKIHQDIYQLTGAIGIDVWRGMSVGGRVDFTAANSAKYKDLRHKNKLMNLDASLALYLPLATWMNVGGNYRYLRHSESLIFSTYSSNDITYKSLIEYGAMTGIVEQFGSSVSNGLTSSSTEKPLFYDGHGYGVQVQFGLAPGLTWTNTWDMAYLKGYYGKDTPYNIVYMRHHTHRYLFTTRLQYRTKSSLHHLDATIENEKLRNFQNQYRFSTNEHGAQYYEYFQPLKTADKVWVNTRICYTGYFGMKGETPTWQLQGGARIAYRKLTANNYPYYRRQHWTSTEGYVNVARNLFLRKGILTFEGGFSYLKGKGAPYEDGTYVAPSDKQTQPDEMTAFLYREYAALMAPQYALRAAVQYAFIFPSTQLKSYVRTDFAYRHCNVGNDFLQGVMHWNLAVTLGVNF